MGVSQGSAVVVMVKFSSPFFMAAMSWLPLLVSGVMFDPVRQTVTLPMRGDINWFYRSFIANENTNIFLRVQCSSMQVNSMVNQTFAINWLLHYIPCGATRLDGVLARLIKDPCQNGSETEFIASETRYINCNPNSPIVTLPSEQLTPPTSFPACRNGSVHKHQNSDVLATTWRTGGYVFYADVAPINATLDTQWAVQMNLQVRSPSGGFLPAPNQPLLPFWASMMAAYCILLLAWIIICGKDWRGVVRLHTVISVALLAGFSEAVFSLLVVNGVNRTGYPKNIMSITAEVVAAFKATIIRVLLIVIAMGFGSTKANRFRRPLFGPVAVFGIVYFISVAVPAVMAVLKPVYIRMVVYSRIPSVVVNAISVTWIVISLFKTARILKQHDDKKKLAVYNLLIGILAICFTASVAFIAVRIYIGLSANCPQWQLWWLDDGFWAIVGYVLLLAICVLWRPSQTTLMWAYSSLLNDEDETYSRRTSRELTANSNL